jgi:O-antigen ligase
MTFNPKLADSAAFFGYVIAAALGIGLVQFASYFVFGIFFAMLLSLTGIGIFTAVALGFVVKVKAISRPKWLYLWIILMILLTLIGQFETNSPHASGAFNMLISTIIILLCGILIWFLSNSWDFDRSVYIFPLTVAFILAAALVIVDPIVDFRSTVPGFDAAIYERTRAGGLYLQPNIASTALNLLFLALLPRVTPAIATLLAAILFFAVILTFSRSGILLSVLILSIGFLTGKISRLQVMLVIFIVFFLSFSDVSRFIIEAFDITSGSGFNRLTNIETFFSMSGAAQDSRTIIADNAFVDFFDAPIIGHGAGYSWEWAENQPDKAGTHNIYLRYMLEFGFMGVFIWPGLILAIYCMRHPSLPRVWGLAIFGFSLFIGFFSHNLPEQEAMLIPIFLAYVLPCGTSLNQRTRIVR